MSGRAVYQSRHSHQHHGDANEHGEEHPGGDHEDKLPQEITSARLVPTLPTFTDRTFAPKHRVEQNEPEHTVDVQKDKEQNDGENENRRNQAGELGNARRINVGERRSDRVLAKFRTVRSELPKFAEVTSADVDFSSQDCDQREARPLSQAKAGKQLLPGVLDRRLNAIDGGYGHGALSLTGAEYFDARCTSTANVEDRPASSRSKNRRYRGVSAAAGDTRSHQPWKSLSAAWHCWRCRSLRSRTRDCRAGNRSNVIFAG